MPGSLTPIVLLYNIPWQGREDDGKRSLRAHPERFRRYHQDAKKCDIKSVRGLRDLGYCIASNGRSLQADGELPSIGRLGDPIL